MEFVVMYSTLWIVFALGYLILSCEHARESRFIPACMETTPVRTLGDAADDAAIWLDNEQPSKSVVFGTNKQSGLHVYNLDGSEIQFIPLGGTNNVDLRQRFTFPDGSVAPIVAVSTSRASKRDSTIMLLRFDQSSRRLQPEPLARISPAIKTRVGLGVCLHQSDDGTMHLGAIGESRFWQWRLESEPNASIKGELVREVKLSSSAEACVFDDAQKRLYIAEEDLGLWRLAAEPKDGDAMTLVDTVEPTGKLSPDVEGLAVFTRENGTGYIIVSSQGSDSFHIYRREGENEFIGKFRVIGCSYDSVDEVTGTDGIEVSSASLGPNWRKGILVVQDHKNTNPEEPQNFKFVSWGLIEREFKLD
jgi:3-phytase